jgi:hypothetical protein
MTKLKKILKINSIKALLIQPNLEVLSNLKKNHLRIKSLLSIKMIRLKKTKRRKKKGK